MSGNLLASIRAAVSGWSGENETGAAAPHAEETVEMTTESKPAAGADAGIPKVEHDAAVAAARSEGMAAGAKDATDRLSGALGAEGVKGDAGRMAAALDLAVKSPGMSGADVAAFVMANVPASSSPKAGAADPSAYVQQRLDAAGAAQPGARQPAADAVKSGWTKAVASANQRFATEKQG